MSRGGVVRRVLLRATRPPVLTLLALVNLGVSLRVAAWHFREVEGPRAPSGRIVTGDFLAFYTGGSFVREGRGESLYDLEAQRRFQLEGVGPDGSPVEGLAPPRGPAEEPSGEAATGTVAQWQPYVNPPLLAVAVAPLTGLAYRTAYLAFALAMLLAFLGTLWLLSRRLPRLRRDRWVWLTAVLLAGSWLPVFRTMAGAQNSVLTFFLLAGVYAAWRGERPIAAGIFLGALSYKPQYALLLALVLLLRGETRALAAAGVVAGGHFALGAAFVAPDWPLRMLRALSEWGRLATANDWSHISLPRALRHTLPDGAAWPLVVLGVGAVVLLCLRPARRIGPADPRFPAWFALLVTGTLLVSPHLQYYDVAVLVLPASLLLDAEMRGRGPSLRIRLALAAGYLLYPAYLLGDDLGFQPLLIWPLAFLAWSWNLLRREGSSDAGGARSAVEGTPTEPGPVGPIRGGPPG